MTKGSRDACEGVVHRKLTFPPENSAAASNSAAGAVCSSTHKSTADPKYNTDRIVSEHTAQCAASARRTSSESTSGSIASSSSAAGAGPGAWIWSETCRTGGKL